MDHETVEATGTLDRYLLDELTPEERIAFEAHYFDCAVCAEKVRTGAVFIDTAREVMRAERVEAAAKWRDRQNQTSWPGRLSAWLTPGRLVPSLIAAGLAVVVCYQNMVTLPALETPQLLSTSVIAPLARGEAATITIDRRLPRFNLNFLVDSPRVYSGYICQFSRVGGGDIMTLDSGPRDVSSFTLSFLLRPGQFPPGSYELTLRPQSDRNLVVQRYTFVVDRGGPG
jgi:hypothetical protein